MSPTRPRIRLPIQTERLVLRPMMQDDAPAMHEVYGDTDVMRFLTPDVPRTLEETRRWVQAKIDLFERDDGMSLWSVVERTSGNVIGDCGLQWEEPRAGEPAELALGGRGGRASWGNGYGTEAAVACLIAAFRDLEVDRIVGMTHADNRPPGT